jgi:hypothetical protein
MPFHRTMIATLGVCILAVLPIYVPQTLPLYDYQFHIVRMYILSHWHTSSALQSQYTIDSFMLSNIAMDIIVPWLAHWISIEAAGRLFIAATIVLQITGCMALYRSIHGHYRLWPLVASLFVFNWIFIFAFSNYLFGIGLLLWAVALWLALTQRSLPLSIVCGTVFSVVLFFCHLLICGLFAVIIAGYELQRAFAIRKHNRSTAVAHLAAGVSIFTVPAILSTITTTASGASVTSHTLTNLLRTPPLFVRSLLSADWTLDILLIATIITFCVIVVMAGRITIARSMRLVIVLLAVTYVVIPHVLLDVWGVDSRIPILIIYVLIASTDPVFNREIWRRAVGYGLFAIIVIRSMILTYNWYSYDKVYAEFRRAFDTIPAGSVLFTASEDNVPSIQDINLHLWQPPLYHVATLAVMSHDIFVAQIAAKPGQQPISVTPRYQPMHQFVWEVATDDELNDLVTQVRSLAIPFPAYLLVLYPQHRNLALPKDVKVIASSTNFLLLAL